MIIKNEVQGTDAWLKLRLNHPTASEANVMMCASPYATRNDLLKVRATGIESEIDSFLQKIFDKGHEVENLARPLAEEIIGEELYPVTAADDDDYLLGSFDGVTVETNIIWECKQMNAGKVRNIEAGIVPESDYWQVQQQLLVSGAEKCLYMVTDGTKDNCFYTWVYSDKEAHKKLISGWKQFKEDLKNWKPTKVKQEVTGKSPDSLPALNIEVTGLVTSSNLNEFKNHALAVIDDINTELSTDEDFANAESTVKWCTNVEKKLNAAKEHALSQTASIDELFRTIDQISEEARNKRLELNNLVKSRKEKIKIDLVMAAKATFNMHVDMLNSQIAPCNIGEFKPDFGAAIKGKRTIKSMISALDDLTAKSKIEANEIAGKIFDNLESFASFAEGYKFLFNDLSTLALKDHDDFAATIKMRINDYDNAEEKRQSESKQTQKKLDKEMRLEIEKPVINSESQEPQRPSDHEIILCVAKTFNVSQQQAIVWLSELYYNIHNNIG